MIKYTLYPAYLPEPTTSVVPYAPVRVLIIVPPEAVLDPVNGASETAKSMARTSVTDAARCDLLFHTSHLHPFVFTELIAGGPFPERGTFDEE